MFSPSQKQGAKKKTRNTGDLKKQNWQINNKQTIKKSRKTTNKVKGKKQKKRERGKKEQPLLIIEQSDSLVLTSPLWLIFWTGIVFAPACPKPPSFRQRNNQTSKTGKWRRTEKKREKKGKGEKDNKRKERAGENKEGERTIRWKNERQHSEEKQTKRNKKRVQLSGKTSFAYRVVILSRIRLYLIGRKNNLFVREDQSRESSKKCVRRRGRSPSKKERERDVERETEREGKERR